MWCVRSAYRSVRHAKLRESVNVVRSKKLLRCSLLNVDGLNEASLASVEATVASKSPDVVILLETKRRFEESGIDISIPGYSLREARRSNNAGDRDGGGLAVYTKLGDGILFKEYKPDIADRAHAFVNSERMWTLVESQTSKTAICGLYLACQYGDDRFGQWNNIMYDVIQREAFALRSKGFRVVYLGDFNGHLGNNLREGGIIGNTPGVNPNGRRLLNFISVTDSVNINSLCKVPGDWGTRVCSGLWTRQRGGFSSIIDYALVSKEHADTVVSMLVDDKGILGGGSDHNWIILDIADKFVKKLRITNQAMKKDRWNISDDQNWDAFKAIVHTSASSVDETSVDNLASTISASILHALHSEIGLKPKSVKRKPRLLPPALVSEFRIRDQLETNWKTLNSANANTGSSLVNEAETLFNDQKTKVSEMLSDFRSTTRSKTILQCSGNSRKARRNFWSHVCPSKKQTTDLSAVVDPVSGVVKCDVDEIKIEVEKHLTSVFQGSFEKIPPIKAVLNANEHSYCVDRPTFPGAPLDHGYSVDPSPSLLSIDSSGTLERDPSKWLNKKFTAKEVKMVLKMLKNGKAYGWDQIPNEALKNLPDSMIDQITLLFNMIKSSGILPQGWNRGRITLVHKRGLRESLGNYRPITVLVSLSGLYSKVLNERLIAVVETHKLLGEIQCGFRKNRCGADNTFVLDTILWKYRATGKPVHMSFIDICKAYDTVNRAKLWKKLSSLGFSGEFLSTLKSLYTDDSVDCQVNGLTTRTVYLRRGLRQGCALSPLLFALYIMDVGNDINMSQLGFMVGRVCVSGILFADDLLVVARSAAGLKTLLAIVKSGFDKLKLTISVEKSPVVSPVAGNWDVVDNYGQVVLSLDQVELYKYLGTWTYNSMYRTSVEKQKHCVKTAHKYKSSCIHVSRMGPDVVDVVLSTWSNVAVPAILSGCEMIPFCGTRLAEIERIQAQIAKFALGISSTCPNVCAQTELGLKPFKQLLYECQLKFYFRALYLHEDRWVHQALLDHLSGDWTSPYVTYITSIRAQLGIFSPVPAPSIMKKLVGEYFLAKTNECVSTLRWFQPLKKFSRASYVCENESSAVLTEFKLDCAGLGNKQPRLGHVRKPFCPVCPGRVPNTGIHMLFSCGSTSSLRLTTGIQAFITQCLLRGISMIGAYKLFVNGYTSQRKPISQSDYLERGKSMNDMRALWLTKW